MQIKGAKNIADYRKIRDAKVQEWVDRRFVPGSVIWRWITAREIEIEDRTGDTMWISIDEI